MVVNSPRERPFEDLNQVGLALTTYDEPPGPGRCNHVAVIYRFGDEPVTMLHFDSRFVIRTDRCKESYLWLDLGQGFSDVDRAIICAHAKKVADANHGSPVSYGYDMPGGYIDGETGKLKPSFGDFGLTCSTFVLEVFESCGFRVLKAASWPKPPVVDKKWQESMLKKKVLEPGLGKEIYERQRRNIGNRRIRPEEVAASTQVNLPAVRGGILNLAKKIRKRLKAHFASLKS